MEAAVRDRKPGLPAAAALALAAAMQLATAPRATAQQKDSPELDSTAIAALEKMGGYLRGLKQFEVTALTTTDEVMDKDLKAQFAGTVNIKVIRPNKLRMEVNSDRKERQLFYDGNSITLYAPRVRYYAIASAPPTLRETIEVLTHKYGVEMPLADLFLWGTDEAPLQDIKLAYALGPATTDGVKTQQYLFRQEGVDWQVWIEQGPAPRPRKLVITTTDEAAQPSYSAVLRWNTAPKFSDKTFAFTPPSGAMKIVLRSADGK